MINYVNLSLLVYAYNLCTGKKFDFELNVKNPFQYADNAKTHENSKYNKSEVRYITSRNTQAKQFQSQKGFLLCKSCFWCASSLYLMDDRIKVSLFLQCPNCYNNKVELLPLLL